MQGTVRIACGELIGRYLTAHLDHLLDGAPDLQLEVVSGRRLVNLFSGEAEIALPNQPPEQVGLFMRRLGRCGHGLYGSQKYLAGHPEARAEQRFQKCRFVSFAESDRPSATYRWLKPHLPSHEPSLRFTGSGLILEVACKGLGLAVLPHYLSALHPELERVMEVDLVFDTWMVMHTDARRLPRVGWVAQRIATLLEKSWSGYAEGS